MKHTKGKNQYKDKGKNIIICMIYMSVCQTYMCVYVCMSVCKQTMATSSILSY